MSKLDHIGATANRPDMETDSLTLVIVQRAIKHQARRSLAGFLILMVGVGAAIDVSVQNGCKGRRGNAVAIGTLLQRLNTANSLQYQQGSITLAQRKAAIAYYKSERARLVIPTCKFKVI